MAIKDRLTRLERETTGYEDIPDTPLGRALESLTDEALRELISAGTARDFSFDDLPPAVRSAIIAERSTKDEY